MDVADDLQSGQAALPALCLLSRLRTAGVHMPIRLLERRTRPVMLNFLSDGYIEVPVHGRPALLTFLYSRQMRWLSLSQVPLQSRYGMCAYA